MIKMMIKTINTSSLFTPTWQWPSSSPGNPAEHSIGHTWLSCGTFRGSFLGLHWSQRQFLLLLSIPPPPPHCPISRRTYISSSGGLRRGQRLHRWLLEEKTWVSIFWKLTSIQCSFVTLVSFHSHCNLLKARQQARWTLIDWIFSVALFIQCPMQVVRTKLFDIIADPKEDEYKARRRLWHLSTNEETGVRIGEVLTRICLSLERQSASNEYFVSHSSSWEGPEGAGGLWPDFRDKCWQFMEKLMEIQKRGTGG